ncbi:peptide synthetase [Vibrio alginolyticus]|uniref:condensation domain-containing protein n=1 Tax=Vibrio alginolyticus TaxID=663 RepID=UPI001BD681E2|nr:condensation domain-containing protein [Vibrio alginolyticus]MBS9968891.1 peptide synthetase [Vibrio alginolyticus]
MSDLTPMQAACWFGREANAKLGGVASHLYTEFDGENINLEKLNLALVSLYHRHEMLRLKVDEFGLGSIVDVPNHSLLEIDDFSLLSKDEQNQALSRKRDKWAHQMLDLTQGQAAKFSVSLLSDGAFRLHIDTDMIAIDPDSCRILIEDFAKLYEGVPLKFIDHLTFFTWHDLAKTDPDLKLQRKADRQWWKSQLASIAPAPSLPLPDYNPSQFESHHYSARLEPELRKALLSVARQHLITPANLMLGLFARALGKATGDTAFRINVPTFWRPPIVEGTNDLVGDFVNFVVLSVDMNGSKTLIDFCHLVAIKMSSLLGHSRYDGVNVMRDLSVHHGSAQLAPIVFTSAIDLPSGDLFSRRVHKHFGKMNWTISQGSQVALDSQVVSIDGGIMINWDVRHEALPKEWTSPMFEHFVALTKSVISDPSLLVAPLENLQTKLICQTCLTAELTPMQRAYLLGRTTQMPLGGVAMQEMLEYRGVLSAVCIRRRLSKMVANYPSLRKFIDSKSLKLRVSKCPQLNLNHVDLSQLKTDMVEEELGRFRYRYSHEIFDLEQPLWNITTFTLPDAKTHVFARFDALILDARSIASLLVELFEGEAPSIPRIDNEPNGEDVITQRAKDEKYWMNKLSTVEGIMRFPWHKSLESISSSRYKRQSLEIGKDTMEKLVRVGGKHGLYKNTVMMSVAMEALSSLVSDGKLCVAVPVSPMISTSYASESTFIALQWDTSQNEFLQRAQALQADMLEGLEHLSFSGVDLARTLFDRCRPGPTLPIVITNGLSWPALSDNAPMTLQRGLTQTPQVAIDVRFVAQAGGSIMFSIDYASEAVVDELVKLILDRIDMIFNHMIQTSKFEVVLNKQLSPDESRVIELLDSPPKEASTVDSTKQIIFDIYCRVIGRKADDDIDENMLFAQLGLRPNHLKEISNELKKALPVELPVKQLIRCKDANDVTALALQQGL